MHNNIAAGCARALALTVTLVLALLTAPCSSGVASAALTAQTYTAPGQFAGQGRTSPLASQGVRVTTWAGGSNAAAITIVNTSDTPREFRLEAVGLQAINGVLEFVRPAPLSSAAQWLTFDDRPQTVPANTTVTAPVIISAPAGTSPGDYPAGLLVRDVSPTRGGAVTQTPLYVDIPGPKAQKIVFQEARLSGESGIPTPFRARPVTLEFTLVNTGNSAVRGDLTVNVQSVFGMSGMSKTYRDVVLLPRGTLKGKIPVTVLPTLTVTPHAILQVPFTAPVIQTFSDAPVIETYKLEALGTVTFLLPVPELIVIGLILASALAGWIALRRWARRAAA